MNVFLTQTCTEGTVTPGSPGVACPRWACKRSDRELPSLSLKMFLKPHSTVHVFASSTVLFAVILLYVASPWRKYPWAKSDIGLTVSLILGTSPLGRPPSLACLSGARVELLAVFNVEFMGI